MNLKERGEVKAKKSRVESRTENSTSNGTREKVHPVFGGSFYPTII